MATEPSSTVLKAFTVLELFREHPQVGVSQCAEWLGLPRPTAHRLLVSLTAAGALERTPSGSYRLALRMFEIGAQAPFFRALDEQAEIAMEQLVAETRLQSHLGVRQDTEVVYLKKSTYGGGRVETHIGLRNPLHATGLGKLLLSFSPPEAVQLVVNNGLQRFTPYTVTHARVLCEQLAEIRESGFAYDYEERQLGIVCIATGIHSRDDKIVAALSLTAPAESHRRHLDGLRRPLRRAADSIQDRIARVGQQFMRTNDS